MKFVQTEIRDRVATVTLNRPPVNALTAEMFREITQTFTELGRSKDASVIVFTAPGDRLFCAGVDLKDSARRHSRELAEGDTVIDLLDPGATPRDCFNAVLDCPLPVIAAVNGLAIGAGLVLIACCDIIVAAENASFSVPEIKAGVLGGARHLQRLVGTHKTRVMYLTGEPVPAQEFYRLGAVESVVPADQLQEAARALALKIAKHSPLGLRLGKEAMNRVEDMALKDGYRLEQDYTGRVTRYNDSKEARTAYMEKREPDWSWS
ncbi:enoyl-CoA hydratase-related protein [Noviherbaspirillum saxi]|uniref:Enoyl-CoA hydratase n=1 Tax=Noviherbaspirillum saxi TaxID=2320863 RepID=A0A3A3G0T6_9BURK|nr:enoyl-CoA hydratase-related protein [Noviherbaspirillum saxi]RJF91683.1 enoyl-CoA hydratase [Noviherbaspirillum saxi]